ncbi:hypothetical protein HDU98_005866, partial [Podochytrium sp. JEL0797]
MAATSNSINMSLDDLISQNKTGGRTQNKSNLGPDGLPRAARAAGTGGGNGPTRRGASNHSSRGDRNERAPRATPYAANPRQQPAASLASAAAQLGQGSLSVSNLNQNISQQDFHELFSTIGPVKSAVLNFDQNARSKGTGTVIYRKHQDTQRAINEFNGRQFDGRPMRIELIVSAASLASLAARAAPAAGYGGQQQQQRGGDRSRGAARGGRGAQRGGRGGRNGGGKGPAKTPEELAAQLDAEMDKYMQ